MWELLGTAAGSQAVLCLVVPFVILAMAGFIAGGFALLNPKRSATDRLTEFTATSEVHDEAENDAQMEQLAQRIGALAKPTTDAEESLLRMRLIHGGYRSQHALEMYNAARVVLALSLPVLASPLLTQLSFSLLAGAVVLLAAVGYYIPALVVSNRVQTRQRDLLLPLPDALDLLVSSVEAGLSLDAAFRRVAEEVAPAAPELARELMMVNHEISAGVPRIDALRHFARRTGLEEIRSLVNMLTQAERFGTSIARSLRIHSNITRQRRMLRAEEAAAKVSPKLTVVMILFLLPCLIIVLLGPACINIKNTFGL